LAVLFAGSFALAQQGCSANTDGGAILLPPIAEGDTGAGTDVDGDGDGTDCPDCTCNCEDDCCDGGDVICECSADATATCDCGCDGDGDGCVPVSDAEEVCDDGIDDDCDGDIDCDDSDCAEDPACDGQGGVQFCHAPDQELDLSFEQICAEHVFLSTVEWGVYTEANCIALFQLFGEEDPTQEDFNIMLATLGTHAGMWPPMSLEAYSGDYFGPCDGNFEELFCKKPCVQLIVDEQVQGEFCLIGEGIPSQLGEGLAFIEELEAFLPTHALLCIFAQANGCFIASDLPAGGELVWYLDDKECICDDEIDNDGDGARDCADEDCENDEACETCENTCETSLDCNVVGGEDCEDGCCDCDFGSCEDVSDCDPALKDVMECSGETGCCACIYGAGVCSIDQQCNEASQFCLVPDFEDEGCCACKGTACTVNEDCNLMAREQCLDGCCGIPTI
jgi:hypothetical protein